MAGRLPIRVTPEAGTRPPPKLNTVKGLATRAFHGNPSSRRPLPTRRPLPRRQAFANLTPVSRFLDYAADRKNARLPSSPRIGSFPGSPIIKSAIADYNRHTDKNANPTRSERQPEITITEVVQNQCMRLTYRCQQKNLFLTRRILFFSHGKNSVTPLGPRVSILITARLPPRLVTGK